MTSLVLTALIVALTELIKRLRAADFWAVATILSAGAIGLVLGLLGVEGLTVWSGLVNGLAATGIVTGLQALGTPLNTTKSQVNSTPSVS